MIVNEILSAMNTQMNRIVNCLNHLSEDQIWYKFKPNMNSIGNLCVHLAGNEYQHFVSGIGIKPNIRNRTLEFTAEGTYTKQQLQQLLTDTREQSTAILMNLTEDDLKKDVKIHYSYEDWNTMKERGPEEKDPGYVRPIEVILLQVCEHYGYHTGQIVLLTKLLEDVQVSISGYKH